MSGSIGCGGLGVSGGGGDSVIRISENVNETATLGGETSIIESISESVTILVT